MTMDELFERQIEFQRKLTGMKILPCDSPFDFRDQVCLMAEEFGELVKTDKRWRNFDGSRRPVDGNKLDEIADVMIVAMNLAIFSGYNYADVVSAMNRKIMRNEGRLPDYEKPQNPKV